MKAYRIQISSNILVLTALRVHCRSSRPPNVNGHIRTGTLGLHLSAVDDGADLAEARGYTEN